MFLPKACGSERDLHLAFRGIVETSELGKMSFKKVPIKAKDFERLLDWMSDLLPNCDFEREGLEPLRNILVLGDIRLTSPKI